MNDIIDVESRRALYDFFQLVMEETFPKLASEQKLIRNLIKSYIFEVNNDINFSKLNRRETVDAFKSLFKVKTFTDYRLIPKEENGFIEIRSELDKQHFQLFIDTTTNNRFWFGFSTGEATILDKWLENFSSSHINFDFVWLWPKMLEKIQQWGFPRGFGLDYDNRKFEDLSQEETTNYLKMQIWGGDDTKDLYNALKEIEKIKSKIVLSKIRVKQIEDNERFSIQDIKFNGKSTIRGNDFDIHLLTLNQIRKDYHNTIRNIEEKYSTNWTEDENKEISLSGFAIKFTPMNYKIPVHDFINKGLNGTYPFRILGFNNFVDEKGGSIEAIDLHTGGKISFEIYDDRIFAYLPKGTCGNTIARLFINLQQVFGNCFEIEGDDGNALFE